MGGRLDSTNVVTPAVSVLTAIDLDHQTWLGSSLREIAAEKAGIIKAGVPVVSGPQHPEVESVLRATAVEQTAALRFVTDPLGNHEIALPGQHQKLNAALAVAALELANLAADDKSIRAGLRAVEWPGRFQRLIPVAKSKYAVVLDGAHNPAAASLLAATWREVFAAERATIIAGILSDKDVAGICAALAPIAASFIATPVQNPRTSSAAAVCGSVRNTPCIGARDLADALDIALRRPEHILITGSLFLVGEALVLLGLSSDEQELTVQ
jgi:dihydrofolate synthase/folylpolyglutamate synthase